LTIAATALRNENKGSGKEKGNSKRTVEEQKGKVREELEENLSSSADFELLTAGHLQIVHKRRL
jgi:hypothetical protein